MKKLFKMSAVILFVLIVFSACGRNESVSGKITSFPPYGERVVTAIGDSIAAGYGLDSQEDNYLTLFSDNIGAVLNNDAVSGYDSGEVLKSLSDKSEDHTLSAARGCCSRYCIYGGGRRHH